MCKYYITFQLDLKSNSCLFVENQFTQKQFDKQLTFMLSLNKIELIVQLTNYIEARMTRDDRKKLLS